MQEPSLNNAICTLLDDYFTKLNGESAAGANLHTAVLGLVEKPLIERCLEHTAGNQQKCAEILGINRNTLRKRIQEYKIKPTAATSKRQATRSIRKKAA